LPGDGDFMGHRPAPNPKILGPLKKRLAWEITMEYGFNARVGRTLDKVRCSTARLDEGRLTAALGNLQTTLANQFAQLSEVTPARLRHFVVGLLTRTRVLGWLYHILFRDYPPKQARLSSLTNDITPLLPPLTPHTPLPLSLSNSPNENVSDSALPSNNRRNWYLDWAQKCLWPDFDG